MDLKQAGIAALFGFGLMALPAEAAGVVDNGDGDFTVMCGADTEEVSITVVEISASHWQITSDLSPLDDETIWSMTVFVTEQPDGSLFVTVMVEGNMVFSAVASSTSLQLLMEDSASINFGYNPFNFVALAHAISDEVATAAATQMLLAMVNQTGC